MLHPLSGTPFGTALDVCLVFAVLTYLATLLTRAYVWVERRWEIFPPVVCLIVAAAVDFESARLNLMTGLVFVWSLRLSHNCLRKGGFRRGGDDYRWGFIQRNLGRVGFVVHHVTFVLLGHMLVIWLFTAPIHTAWQWSDAPLNGLDAVAVVLFLVFLVGETVADQQMWAFQQDKRRRIAAGEDVVQPFITTGLWRFSRHPSWFCEIGMWWVFYLFAVAASGQWVHWTMAGFIVLTAVFIGSLRTTEAISVERYPAYRDYQAATSALVPTFPRRGR